MTSVFQTVVGTGGLGSGIIYRLQGAHDLGRNESRLARRVDQRDFCKLHIVLHYVAVLSRDLKLRTRVFPVGAVGDDETGRELRTLMRQAGMNLKYVSNCADARTLFSVCYQFPDGAGGNLTESNSASGKVSPAMIRQAVGELGPRSLAVAVPEVPLASRLALLRLAKQHGAFTAASFVADEMAEVRRRQLLSLVDLLALNMEEAAALAGLAPRKSDREIVAGCRRFVCVRNPRLRLCLTAGAAGLYGLNGSVVEHLPALKVKVVNTAGAGDAALAGLVLGVLTGQNWAACCRLGRLLSALSVTAVDTIHFGVNRRLLEDFAAGHGEKLGW